MAIPLPPVKPVTQTIGKSTDGSSNYRLSYNAATKQILGLVYSNGITEANLPVVLFTAATYAAIQTEAASLGLTGLPAQLEGQP